jgi:4-hydroxy-3-methylbut-2-en-1-yl diphosphate synthase IspG/GcpE
MRGTKPNRAKELKLIKGIKVPLVADIHLHKMLLDALRIVEKKVRINRTIMQIEKKVSGA